MTATELPYGDVPGQTHWDGCWRARGHHNCAVREIERLRAAPREPGEAERLAALLQSAFSEGFHRGICAGHDLASYHERDLRAQCRESDAYDAALKLSAPRPDAGDGTGETG
jgi:hypothetical protein